MELEKAISYENLSTYTKDLEGKFVSQVEGKGLSSNDYTDNDKAKIDSMLTQDDFETVPIVWTDEM